MKNATKFPTFYFKQFDFEYSYPGLACLFSFYLFYVYVFKENRKVDEKTALFPITSHFYKMVRTTNVLFLMQILFGSMASENLKTGELFHYAEWFIHYCLYVITQVFHFLIFLQTFERFIMYFTKSAENFVKISQQYLIRRSWILYIVFVMKDLILGIFWFLANVTVDIQKWYTHEIVYLVVFLLTNFLAWTSAVLYIPIFISVRKLSQLTSAQFHSPHIYIFWQSIVVVVFKIHFIKEFISYLYFDYVYCFSFIISTLHYDIYATPLIIQVSYISSNRRNVRILLTSFSVRRFLRVLFNMGEVSVEPLNF
ncbi:Serpentine receptor class gamma [Caenorhabditis elegans]|uniref:Serpentine receptor class gamma n=1 Tax=Caenorhabditis elegans TaxID=6239 RepID=Q688B8_CAEEL|nr:Serpentine receptor class gamma [Caenorhabditis elegans]CCD64029.1 Serpentine receptor class gamma [Caenorhabditis elegans]|eukprot:NP_001021316.1 Serpentine Receptor, class Z [Caenorhabditis elegans]